MRSKTKSTQATADATPQKAPCRGQKRTTITCAHSPHRDRPLPAFRYFPPPTSKGEIPHPAAGSHPRKQVSTCQGLVIPTSSGTLQAVPFRPVFSSNGSTRGLSKSSSMRPAVWDTPGASDYTPRRGRNEIVSEPNMLLDLSKRFEMRSAIVALGLVLCSIPPCLAMPVAPLPTLRPSIRVHGCHHQYAHDLTGWHRHDNNCRTPR
jgi:hypothetical protein